MKESDWLLQSHVTAFDQSALKDPVKTGLSDGQQLLVGRPDVDVGVGRRR